MSLTKSVHVCDALLRRTCLGILCCTFVSVAAFLSVPSLQKISVGSLFHTQSVGVWSSLRVCLLLWPLLEDFSFFANYAAVANEPVSTDNGGSHKV